MTRRSLLTIALVLASSGVVLVVAGLLVAPAAGRITLGMGLAWAGVTAVKLGFIIVVIGMLAGLRGTGGDTS